MDREIICYQCTHSIRTRMRLRGQAEGRNGGGKVELIGPVVQDVMNIGCMLTTMIITPDAHPVSCTEFEQRATEPDDETELLAPLAEPADAA